MAFSLNFFTDATVDVQQRVSEHVRELQAYADIIAAFDKGKEYLRENNLPNRALDKAKAFVSTVGASNQDSNLWTEVSKLGKDQQAFCAISFTTSQLRDPKILEFFKASHVNQYMNSRKINLTQEQLRKIEGRIQRYATDRFLHCCPPQNQPNTNETNIFDSLNERETVQCNRARVDSLPALFAFLASLQPLQESETWRIERETGQTEHTNCVVAYLRGSGDYSLLIRMGGEAARNVVALCNFTNSSRVNTEFASLSR